MSSIGKPIGADKGILVKRRTEELTNSWIEKPERGNRSFMKYYKIMIWLDDESLDRKFCSKLRVF